MQLWVLLVLLVLLVLSAARQHTGRVEVTRPVRVSSCGDPLPSSLHYRRRRRSSEEPHWSSTTVQYTLAAFGQHFQLRLFPETGFIAPHYTVSVLGNMSSTSTSSSSSSGVWEDTDLQHCFYTGNVNGNTDHTAVISLCSGMLGTFRSPDGEYFVEPLHTHEGEHYEEEYDKPHLVYKKKSQQEHADNTKECDTSAGHKHADRMSKVKTRRRRDVDMLADLESLHTSLASHDFLRTPNAHTGNNSSSTQAQRRSKRFLSYPRFVEVMVVADSKMVEHHGSHLQHYVLTLMSIVSSIYKDPTIGNLINIVVVKLVIISSELDGPAVSFNAQTTLKNFCIWQQSQNQADDSHPSHHDTAILITRQDICRARDKCDTLGNCDRVSDSIGNGDRVSDSTNIIDRLSDSTGNCDRVNDSTDIIDRVSDCTGPCYRASDSRNNRQCLAELGTVCDPYRSCSISEDNGLSTAFTIAHELGHVFNMPHDDSNKCKEEGGKTQQHVMAPTLNYNTNPWMWSKCSRKYITEFLDTGYGECLLDEPLSSPYQLPQELPGHIYTVNQQCQFIFGPGMQVCPYMTQCHRLWCASPEGPQKGCRTQHMPWADGTECSQGKHCMHGVCVSKDQDALPLDGAWGVWSPFGTCSRSCGGGIRIALRECNQPVPRNGGRFCVGRRMKFRSCNSEPCARQKKDFREEQCAAFDGRHFNINSLPPNVHWVPKYSGILMKDRCKLFCRVAGSTAYYQLRDRVIDGTPCGPDTNDICVQGLCRQAGCDHVLNSKARRDKCGVCGGDNSSCRTVAGTFNTVSYGYNVVVRIPIGATNIDVRQHSLSGKPEDDNYLAISNSLGEFLLNGDFVVSMFKREIKLGNAVIEYSGSDHVIERINCTDKLEEEVTIQVLSVGNLFNPHVLYTYNIPIEDTAQQFYWDIYGPWQECNQLCQGERRRKVVCMRELDPLVVSDQRCQSLPLPSTITEQCNTACELRWEVGKRGECTAQCGTGYRSLEVHCAKTNRVDGRTQKVDERYCSGQRKPEERELCEGDCNPGGWEYSPWSQCSQSCGGGTRRRAAVCSKSDTGQDESRCNQRDKLTVQPCNESECPQWETGDWSECLVTCGKGYKHRQIWCQFGEERLDDRMCEASKPESVQTCNQQECPSWQVGPWGQCTTTCGPGYQMRAVKCVVGSYGTVMVDIECNAATRPTDTQDCEVSQCPETQRHTPDTKITTGPAYRTQWRFGSWTQCSATCGKGIRMRYVSCRDNDGGVAEESSCSQQPKPPAYEMCSLVLCGQWKVLEWTQCSVSCGQGTATRTVLCVDFSDQQVEFSECDQDERPTSEQDCTMPQCPSQSVVPTSKKISLRPSSRTQANQWRTGPWGACSSTCAGGFQRRVVVCQDEHGNSASRCEERNKPAEQRSCESGSCPQWVYGSWSECTKSCGGGIRTRQVVCQRSNGERFNDLSCEILDKPPDREHCNTQPCSPSHHWNTAPWSSCSAECGKGFKQRKVTCATSSGRPVAEEKCVQQERPSTQRRCRGTRCSMWTTNSWGECSVSCGSGERRRAVVCLDHRQEKVQESQCNERKKPDELQICHMPACEFVWFTGDWSQCSASCGQGYQTRVVSCSQVHSGKESYEYALGASVCPGTKPELTRSCNLLPCTDTTLWRVGMWGPCSVSCGDGVTQRTVQCVSTEGQESQRCAAHDKPEGQKTCRNPICDLPSSCSDVQSRLGSISDGEQLINIQGKARKIYCVGMSSRNPREYLTLPAGDAENYSEVFGFRLSNPTECPHNGSRREDCDCRRDYSAAGLSLFTRVRLDLSRMHIITTDWQFARTQEGQKVPFATAGDCYSAARCPQGRFSVNLSGTGFQVAEDTKWVSQGNYAVADIHKSQDNSGVTGVCGGYCGKCTLSSDSGFHVQVT